MTAEELLWPILESVTGFITVFAVGLLGFSMLQMIGRS